jgi:hypothetical protein
MRKTRNVYRILVEKCVEKHPLGRLRGKREITLRWISGK